MAADRVLTLIGHPVVGKVSSPCGPENPYFRRKESSVTKMGEASQAVLPLDKKSKASRTREILWKLGPGLITGAADDDPSGIATYSQVGAQFGFGMLWTMLFTFPLMAAIQEICARLGRITGAGITRSMQKRFHSAFVYGIVSLVCVANTFNLGADLAA